MRDIMAFRIIKKMAEYLEHVIPIVMSLLCNLEPRNVRVVKTMVIWVGDLDIAAWLEYCRCQNRS